MNAEMATSADHFQMSPNSEGESWSVGLAAGSKPLRVSSALAADEVVDRAGDFLGTISDVTGDQEKLNFTLGTLIYERK